MISLLQATCAHYERCRRGETTGFQRCAPCPAMIKRYEPETDLGAAWALQRAVAPLAAMEPIADSEGGETD